ncbi:uncharacterized protein N7503_001997 [Penicillium pulvis]|uniref:uncharacterized protein n=1 Tax=Penicillium pulvis TaxID=1562058 RepID=UPI002548257B|nr:uncharacterized protein N7503_001997 [Penicillium pulvis]KAJ5809779.1 hypothetical protein N7503_001997 [Penicillium pulvis]
MAYAHANAAMIASTIPRTFAFSLRHHRHRHIHQVRRPLRLDFVVVSAPLSSTNQPRLDDEEEELKEEEIK